MWDSLKNIYYTFFKIFYLPFMEGKSVSTEDIIHRMKTGSYSKQMQRYLVFVKRYISCKPLYQYSVCRHVGRGL